MAKFCSVCRIELSLYNPGRLCFNCQSLKMDKTRPKDEYETLDADDLSDILGYMTAESVKRLGRKGLLPERIPGIKKWLWHKQDVLLWMKSDYKINIMKADKEQLQKRLFADQLIEHFGDLSDTVKILASNTDELFSCRAGNKDDIDIYGDLVGGFHYWRKSNGQPIYPSDPLNVCEDEQKREASPQLANYLFEHYKYCFGNVPFKGWQNLKSGDIDPTIADNLRLLANSRAFEPCPNCAVCDFIWFKH